MTTARRSRAHVGFALVANLAILAIPGLHSAKPVQGAIAVQAPCAPSTACTPGQGASVAPSLSLPAGATPCPASGPAAACLTGDVSGITPGHASVPSGMRSCPQASDKPLPGAATLAACTDSAFDVARDSGPPVPMRASTAPRASAGARWPRGLSLSADSTILNSGNAVVLTATSSNTVTGTVAAIEIFDLTAGNLLAACGQGSVCMVAYAAGGGMHAFAAFITAPTEHVPVRGAETSNTVRVGWLGGSLAASESLAAPGDNVTVTATSTIDVQTTGRWLEIYDLSSHSRLTYCSTGSVCMTTMSAPGGGTHELRAYISGSPDAVSAPIYITWLAVNLTANRLTRAHGGPIHLQATVNVDLAKTPWVLGIYDEQKRLVGQTCTTGMTCAATAWIDDGTAHTYTAVVSTVATDEPGPGARAQLRGATSGLWGTVVAQSSRTQPASLVWGVDSCKAFSSDPAAATGLYRQVVSRLGSPDFWGRYLTDTVCPGISANEIAAASSVHMGILPIYNDYDCSAVNSYATGSRYAGSAVAAAERLDIPQGRVLAIDIEPPGPQCPGAANVDAGFIEGWFDAIRGGGYVPLYYGNGTAGSEFGSAWCAAVANAPTIALDSYLWSFEPSLLAGYSKATAPRFAPFSPGCAATMGAWQYSISTGSDPDVDRDLALSTLPLWYP